MSGDPRVTPLRDGLASRELEGRTAARRYADPERLSVVAAAAFLRRGPDPLAEQLDQVLFGESFDVLDRQGDFAWGQVRRDGYVGFLPLSALGEAAGPPTHRVAALRTYAFAGPDFKSAALGPFSLNSLVTEERREGRYVKAVNGGWFIAEHLAPVGLFETDLVAVAERFLGAAYVWGGREASGLDCSGLLQQALFACGRASPRDSDLQARLGRSIGAADLGRGDLVCWKGHLAIALDAARVLHANAHHMAVTAEPLAVVVERMRAAGAGEPLGYRRL